MKVEHSGRAPGLLATYRFYAVGRVPPGHDDWAARRMGLGRWILAYFALDLAVIFAVGWAGVVVEGGLARLTWIIAVIFNWHLLFAFLTIPRARGRARAVLAPPPASEILAQIGEPVR